MSKITHEEKKPESWIDLADMPRGSYGVTASGVYYYRTDATAACLNNSGQSYTNHNKDVGVKVRLLPIGTKIIIEIQ